MPLRLQGLSLPTVLLHGDPRLACHSVGPGLGAPLLVLNAEQPSATLMPGEGGEEVRNLPPRLAVLKGNEDDFSPFTTLCRAEWDGSFLNVNMFFSLENELFREHTFRGK